MGDVAKSPQLDWENLLKTAFSNQHENECTKCKRGKGEKCSIINRKTPRNLFLIAEHYSSLLKQTYLTVSIRLLTTLRFDKYKEINLRHKQKILGKFLKKKS